MDRVREVEGGGDDVVAARGPADAVRRSGEQGGDARRVVADDVEDHLVDVAFDLAPVVAVAHERGPHVRLALAQTVRARAVGTERRGVLDTLAAIHRLGRLVGLAPLLAHDVEVGEQLGQDRERRIRDDVDRMVVDLADFLDLAHVRLHVGAVALGALVAEDHVIGGERGAIMELDPLAQLETPDRRRRLLPARGQHRRELVVAVAHDQRFVDVLVDADLQRLIERVRIHRQRVALIADPQGDGPGDEAGAGECAECRDSHNGGFEFHESTPL